MATKCFKQWKAEALFLLATFAAAASDNGPGISAETPIQTQRACRKKEWRKTPYGWVP